MYLLVNADISHDVLFPTRSLSNCGRLKSVSQRLQLVRRVFFLFAERSLEKRASKTLPSEPESNCQSQHECSKDDRKCRDHRLSCDAKFIQRHCNGKNPDSELNRPTKHLRRRVSCVYRRKQRGTR